jgi:hypothetical protein
MPTYPYYDDAVAGAALPAEARRHDVVLKKRMKTSDIVASDTTLTTNGVIAAADTIEAVRVPVGFVVQPSAMKIVTPEGGTLTVDVGVAGGDELFDGANLNQAAGTVILTLVGDDWGPDLLTGYAITTADTIDVTYVNETDTVDFWLYVKGFMLW